jgi:hypothetical protein
MTVCKADKDPMFLIGWQQERDTPPMEVQLVHLLAQLLRDFNESHFVYPTAL